jgi:flagellar hook-associated protein 2
MTIPIVSFAGLSTGLDTNSLVSSLVNVAAQPIRRLEGQRASLSAQSSRLTDIRTKLVAVREAAKALDARSEVLAFSATSADDDVVTATATSGAQPAVHQVRVTGLATPERTLSAGFAARDQGNLFGSGTLEIAVGASAPVSITVAAADTLDAVASKINASGADVTAGVIFTGSEWKLQVTGKSTGAANAIAFTETGTVSLGLQSAANQIQAAADATFTVDGIAMTRTSNLVADAIPGVTLTLNGVSGASATDVTVAEDAAALQTKVETFIKTYNEVMQALNREFAWTGAPKGADSLSGDATLRSLQARLRALVGQRIPGIAQAYDTLAGVGLTQGRDGTLTLDASKLAAALSSSPDSVISLFAADSSGGTDGVMARLSTAADDFALSVSGALSVRIDGIGDRVKDLADQTTKMELRLAMYEETLRKQFSALEELVSTLQSQGAQMTSILSGTRGGG